MANIHPLTGQTIRVTVADLTDAGGAELPDATVVIAITDPAGSVSTPSVTQDGDTYYVEFTSSVVGTHRIRATATSVDGTWKTEGQVTVYDFAT